MKEKLYTIPLMEAFEEKSECPLCHAAHKLEENALEFTLGSCASYMESDVREQTDNAGFCKEHLQKMYVYGNTLGNAHILHTHYKKTNQELSGFLKESAKGKSSFLTRFKKSSGNEASPLVSWIRERECSCFICRQVEDTYKRYLDTLFFLFKTSPEFSDCLKHSKGFCLTHFGDIMEYGEEKLNSSQLEALSSILFPLMEENMKRIEEELAWLIDKFDYRNQDAPWKNSKDAIPRGMQKLKSGYYSKDV